MTLALTERSVPVTRSITALALSEQSITLTRLIMTCIDWEERHCNEAHKSSALTKRHCNARPIMTLALTDRSVPLTRSVTALALSEQAKRHCNTRSITSIALREASLILDDAKHPPFSQFQKLQSGRRYKVPIARKNVYKKSFIPSASSVLNSRAT